MPCADNDPAILCDVIESSRTAVTWSSKQESVAFLWHYHHSSLFTQVSILPSFKQCCSFTSRELTRPSWDHSTASGNILMTTYCKTNALTMAFLLPSLISKRVHSSSSSLLFLCRGVLESDCHIATHLHIFCHLINLFICQMNGSWDRSTDSHLSTHRLVKQSGMPHTACTLCFAVHNDGVCRSAGWDPVCWCERGRRNRRWC